MTVVLRQSTERKVRIGPFRDNLDGATMETSAAVVLANMDQAELLKADGAATVSLVGATFADITGCAGWLDLTLTTSHTDTTGELEVIMQDADVFIPVERTFQVITQSAYDNLYGAAAVGPLTAAQVNTEADTALSDINLDHLMKVAVAGADVTDDSVIAQLVSKSATSDWDDFDNTTDSLQAITDSGGAGPSAATIADAVWDEARADHSATGSFGEGVLVDSTAKSGYRLSATGVDDIFDEIYEGSLTFRQNLRLTTASLGGILAGAATTTITMKDNANTKDRITATVDGSGNRDAVVLDLT